MDTRRQAAQNAELSRQYDLDGSVRPTNDNGYRLGMAWRNFVPRSQD